ncbi:hypothetical protein HPB49_023618 [Dermacentor silvarum]|uniref:Uncharacterized protein n=1 Tax=Dermacentor silvarum TaxID=543639 RepID=A0ACB8DLB8_DERSI|nr:hypothetical protein HPB49_023618 [Dermacentor silvarum]
MTPLVPDQARLLNLDLRDRIRRRPTSEAMSRLPRKIISWLLLFRIEFSGSSLQRAASYDNELRSNVVLDDAAYMYGELSKEDFGDIALSVKRTEETPYFAYSAAARQLTFPGLPGQFDMSGNLKYFVPQSPDKVRPWHPVFTVKPRFLLHSNKASDPNKLLFETGLDWRGFDMMASLVDAGQKLYVIVHGFLSSAKTEWMQDMKDEILDKHGGGQHAHRGRSLALLVKTLADAGSVGPERIHYIGHSLGAQTGGFFGKDVKQLTGRLVGRITGEARACLKIG